jgi:serine/threonine protein kinase
MDAMVAERLTASPRIFDIYGFCGLSILSEFFQHGDIEPIAVPNEGVLTEAEKQHLKENGPLKSFNDIPVPEKLRMSLQMAEGIADLHGNAGGVIVHQDVQLAQFLYNSDKSILKLNDFNRAGKKCH